MYIYSKVGTEPTNGTKYRTCFIDQEARLSRVGARWILHSFTKEECSEYVRILRLMLAKWKHEKVYFDNVVTCHSCGYTTTALPPCHDAGPLWQSRARGCGVSGANSACVHCHMPRQTSIPLQPKNETTESALSKETHYYLADQTVSMAYYKKVITFWENDRSTRGENGNTTKIMQSRMFRRRYSCFFAQRRSSSCCNQHTAWT